MQTGAAERLTGRDAKPLPDWGRRGTASVSIASSLSFKDVCHAYAGEETLSGVSFDLVPGEVICLLGRSGCGKSTLLRVATGLEHPKSGEVSVDGKVVSGPGVFVPPEKRGIGMVFQDFALFPHLTILQNVLFGLTRLKSAEAKREAQKALTRVGMEDYQKAFPHQISGGEQQRVALARAIAPRPGILMMDEPFSGLDRRLRDEVREETMAILRETRATSIIVTHDPEEAMRMADRIALMRNGRIVQIGTARDLYHNPIDTGVARFFSEINMIKGEGRDGFVESPLGPIAHAACKSGHDYLIGIRPYSILLEAFDPGGAGVGGRIAGRRFIGETDYVEIKVEGIDRPLISRARLGDEMGIGTDVSISVDPRGILFFDA